MNFWLMKSEPSSYSLDDLARNKSEHWDGVRNYQARNNMKKMKVGDHHHLAAQRDHIRRLPLATNVYSKLSAHSDLRRVLHKPACVSISAPV